MEGGKNAMTATRFLRYAFRENGKRGCLRAGEAGRVFRRWSKSSDHIDDKGVF